MTLDHHDPAPLVVIVGRKSRIATNTVFLPSTATDIRLRGVKWEHESKVLWQLLHDDGVIAAFTLWGDEPPYFVNADDFPADNKPYVVESILTPKIGTLNIKPGTYKKRLS